LLITEYEASQAELNAAQTKNQLNIQRQSAKGAMEDLMVAMGVGVGQTPELTDPLPTGEVKVPDLATALQTAFDKRSELVVYDLQLSDQARRVGVAKEEMRSRTDAVLRFVSRDDDTGLMSRSIFDNGTMTAGIEHTFPVDRRVSEQKKENAERDFEITKQLRLYETEKVAEEVRSACRAVESARLSLEIFSQNMKLADDNVRRAQRMLEEDLGTTRDLLDAQAALVRVEGGRLSALVDLYLASVNLKQAMGEDLTTEMSK
jgi:outer membrane protein TolC